jgi:hypothetical protein
MQRHVNPPILPVAGVEPATLGGFTVVRVRSKKGQSFVELGAVLIVAVPVMLLLADCAFIIIGAATNDAVCRDVARAAASGPPGLLTEGDNRSVGIGAAPYDRAQAVLKHVWITNMPMKVRDTVEIVETITDAPPATIGGAVTGDVSVQTTIDVYPSFLVKSVVGTNTLAFSSRHTVPYTYVVPKPAS